MSYFNYDGARTVQGDKWVDDMQEYKAGMLKKCPKKPDELKGNKTYSKYRSCYKHKRNQTFSSHIYAVLKKLDENASIGKKSMAVMNTLVKDTFDTLMTEVLAVLKASKKKRITSREIQSAVRLLLPGELAKHGVSEGTKAVTRFSSDREDKSVTDAKAAKDAKNKKSRQKKGKAEPKTKTYSKSIMSGLVFPVGRILTYMKKNKEMASGVSVSAGIYLSAELEYLVSEILELACNAARDRKQKKQKQNTEKNDGEKQKKPSKGFRINTRDLYLAIRGDEELDELLNLKDTTIPSAGVVAYIHPELRPKNSAKSEAKPAAKKKSGTNKSGSKKKTPETVVNQVINVVSAETLQNPAQQAQLVNVLENAAESASPKQAAAIEAAISSIEQITASSSDKQAERVADAVVDVLETVVSPPKKTPKKKRMTEVERIANTPGFRK